jgi:hypothetical protein
MAVRARLRIAHRADHVLLECRRHRVLEPLGFLVHVVPRDADHVGQEPLDQPVATDDRLGLLMPAVGEQKRPVVVARDIAVLLETAQHLVHRRGREPHRAGDVRPRDGQLRLHQPVDDLEVFLLGGRGMRVFHGHG